MLLEAQIFNNNPEQIVNVLNYVTNGKLKFKDIRQKFLKAMQSTNVQEKENGIKDLYREIVQHMCISSIKAQTILPMLGDDYINKTLPGEQEQFLNVTRYTFVECSIDTMRFINAMCRSLGYSDKFAEHFGMTAEENRDFLQGLAKPYTVENSRNTFYSVAGTKIIRNELDEKMKDFRGDMWDGDFDKKKANCAISDVYHTYKHVTEEFGKHGRVWRFFHPFETRRMRDIIKVAGDFLDSVGFNVERDGPTALGFIKDNLTQEALAHTNALADYCKLEAQRAEYQAKTERPKEINTARNRLAAAKNMENDPSTSLWKNVIEPIYAKYGLSLQTVGKTNTWALGTENLKIIAENYDVERDNYLKQFELYVKQTHYFNFQRIVGAAIEKKDPLTVKDITEAIEDVAKVSNALADRYTMLYELKETKDLARNSAFGCRDANYLVSMAEKLLQKSNKADLINKEELASAIDKTMKEYKNTYIKDESQLIEEKKEFLVLKEGEWVPKEEPIADDMRLQISVDDAVEKKNDGLSPSHNVESATIEKTNSVSTSV